MNVKIVRICEETKTSDLNNTSFYFILTYPIHCQHQSGNFYRMFICAIKEVLSVFQSSNYVRNLILIFLTHPGAFFLRVTDPGAAVPARVDELFARVRQQRST